MRQHINYNKIIYSVYFVCDMFQYKFNLESFFFLLISDKKYPHLESYLIKKYFYLIYFKFGLRG